MGHPLPRRDRNTSAALVCAEAFQRLAEPFLARIADDVKEGTQPPSRNVGDLVAVASNLAFAVELYIKTLIAQLQHDVPRGHDLGKLYVAIPQHVREEIEKSYEATWRTHWYGKHASITIAKGPADQPTSRYGKTIATSLRISAHSSLDREMSSVLGDTSTNSLSPIKATTNSTTSSMVFSFLHAKLSGPPLTTGCRILRQILSCERIVA